MGRFAKGDSVNKATRLDFTQLLVQWSEGNHEALEQLTPLVLDELHRIAHKYMRSERPGHLLQTTALINEAYLKLLDWNRVKWKNRNHFLGVCANLMRRILVDCARSRDQAKRGGKAQNVPLDEAFEVALIRSPDLIALDEALTALSEFDRRKSKIVELRFFGGLSVEEIAEVLKISPRTVLREWSLAQAWLHDELKGQDRK
jgi:RNA polymerase sigma factor (TIGR02999 family)